MSQPCSLGKGVFMLHVLECLKLNIRECLPPVLLVLVTSASSLLVFHCNQLRGLIKCTYIFLQVSVNGPHE